MERIFEIKTSNNVEVKFKAIFTKLAPDSPSIDRLILNIFFHQTQDLPDKNNFK